MFADASFLPGLLDTVLCVGETGSFVPSSPLFVSIGVSLWGITIFGVSTDGSPGWMDRGQHVISHIPEIIHLGVKESHVCIEESFGRESTFTVLLLAVESI